MEQDCFSQTAYLVHNGKIIDKNQYHQFIQSYSPQTSINNSICIFLHLRIQGGIDRRNRIGSKFGGGGVSSTQQSERERKERVDVYSFWYTRGENYYTTSQY